MKRIFLLSAMIISSFGMMNLQTLNAAVPAQQAANVDATTMAKAKKLTAKINIAVNLHGIQFAKVNDACVEYYRQLGALTNASPAKVTELKNTRDEKIKAALESDQLKSWAGFKE